MRVLLLSHYYHPEHGAPQRRWNSVVRTLREAGHDVAVIAPPPHYPAGRVAAEDRERYRPGTADRGPAGELVVRAHYVPHRGDLLTRSLDHAVTSVDSLRRAVARFGRRAHRPDIVVATAPAVETLVAGNAIAALWRIPLVVEMRDAWPDLVTFVGPASRPGRGRRISAAKAIVHDRVTALQRRADAVVTTTAAFAEILRQRGLDPVHVVRNGTDTARVPWFEPHATGEHDELRCVYLGNLGRSQGLDLVVRAAAVLARRGVPISVRLIGHGAHARALADLAAALDAPVTVSGRVPPSELVQHYAWADSVIVSLTAWEPFDWTIPSKLYEALATGRHVTGILRGESAAIIETSGAGDVVPPGDLDALVDFWEALASDRARLAPRGDGRHWVMNQAERSRLAERYVGILEELVDGRSGGSATPGADRSRRTLGAPRAQGSTGVRTAI